jgi:Fe-S-cluster containining protein
VRIHTTAFQKKTNCIRCGTCCLKGGPALHHEDAEILREGHIGYQHLITIREGEMVYNPVKEKPEPVLKEMVRVAGRDGSPACVFYDEEKKSCGIYLNRFLECRILKCWDTSEILSVIGRDTIQRTDIMNQDDPVVDVIKSHEEECSPYEVERLLAVLSAGKDRAGILKRLSELLRRDKAIRSFALTELELKKEFECFIFGRPLSRILDERGISLSLQS